MAERTYNLTRADITRGYITEADIGTINGVTADFTDLSTTNMTVNAIQEIKEIGYDPSLVSGYGLIYIKSDGNFYLVNSSGDRYLLNNMTTDNIFTLKERATSPSTPSSTYGYIYLKNDNNIYFLNDAGEEYQINSSSFSAENYFSIGGELPGSYPVIRRCTIDSANGDILDTTSGIDIMFNTNADDSPDIEIKAYKMWNAVWNDIADFQELAYQEELIYGKCYYDTLEGARICNEYCQKSVIGIASDTFGFGVGSNNANNVPIAVGGWTLACVDNEYEPGTPLTNNEKGDLTEIPIEYKRDYPERIVAIYKKPEHNDLWGPPGKEIKVNGRHWVKVK